MIIKVIGKGKGDFYYMEASFIFPSESRIKAYAFITSFYYKYDHLDIELVKEEDWRNNEDRYALDLSIYEGYGLSDAYAYGMEYTIEDREGYQTEYFSGRQPRIADYI